MKKIFILVGLVIFSKAYAMSSGPGGFMVADSEVYGISRPNGLSTHEVLGGLGSGGLSFSGLGGYSGMEIPRDFSISTEGPFRMNEYSREMAVVGR